MAHKLLLMAWVQGDQLMGEAAFGDGSFAGQARITVLDAVTKEELLEFRADAQGLFQSTLPAEILAQGNPLLIQADDGAGHLAEEVIAAEELAATAPIQTVARQATAPDQESVFSVDQELMRQMVQEAVRQEVAPMRRDIIALTQSGPDVTEVLGGIGYIIGLASLGAWLLRRR
jgi:nickel transport protein